MTWNLPTTLENIPDEDHRRQLQRQQVQQRRECSSDFSFLHQLLFQHVVQQKNEGVPIQEIENFLRDRKAVKSFFESRGCKFRSRSSRYFRIVNRRMVRDNESVEDDDTDDRFVECPNEDPREEQEGGNTEEMEDGNYKDTEEDQVVLLPNNEIGSEEIGSRTATDSNAWSSVTESVTWLRRRALMNLKRLVKTSKYVILFAAITIVGHFGICHMLDINPLKFFPSLMERRCLIPTHPIIMEMTRPIADCRFCKEDKGNENEWEAVIEMSDAPNKSVFAGVAYLSKPVIIRGGGRSGGMPEEFDFQKLKEIFQSEPGGVDAVSEECQFLPFRSPFATLREAFDKIGENSDWDEPWYIGWSNCHPGVAAKLRKLFPRPNFLPEDSSSSAIDWIFIGSPGLGASMHIDYVKRPSWQAQLSGVKRWLLHPPPECESVCPESVTFTIYPGDLLFLETNTWYHQTFIEGDTFSISIGSEYD